MKEKKPLFAPYIKDKDRSDDNGPDEWLGAEAQVRIQGGQPRWRNLLARRGGTFAAVAWLFTFLAGIVLGGGLTMLAGRDRGRGQT